MHHWHSICVMIAFQKHRYDNNLSLYTVHCSTFVLPFCTSSCIDDAKTRYFCSLSALHTLNFIGFIGDLHVYKLHTSLRQAVRSVERGYRSHCRNSEKTVSAETNSLKSDNRMLYYGHSTKRFSICRPSAILSFQK